MPNKKRMIIGFLLFTLLLLVLAACGGANDEANGNDASNSEEAVVTTRVVTDTETETVTENDAADEAAADSSGEGEPDSATGSEPIPGEPPVGPGDGPKVGDGWVAEVVGEDAPRDGDAFDEDEATLEEAPLAATSASGVDSAETVAVNQNDRLSAGEVDDNAQWDDYLLYLRNYSGPQVITVDVSERHQIFVQDEVGNPVLGAEIIIFDGNEIVQTLLTTSDGRAYFFASAWPGGPNYTVEVVVNSQSTTFDMIGNGAQREWTVIHPAATAPTVPVNLDVLFVLDTTGSMSDEINELKANIEAIASQIDALPAQPNVRFGMVIYRDRGDAYVARTFEFTPDVGAFSEALNEVQAGGGGDYPEDLNTALDQALHVPEWRIEETVSLLFLVADAPPHFDYADATTDYVQSMFFAASHGIKIYPIASSGLDSQGEYVFRQLAQTTGGRFIFLTYAGDSSGEPGAETDFEVEDYSVADLDELVIQIIAEELANLIGQ